MGMHELEEIRLDAFESSKIYKKRTKIQHDRKILLKTISVGDLVQLYDTKLKFFPGKLKSRWHGPFRVKKTLPFGSFVLFNGKGGYFTVNGQNVKPYLADEQVPENSSISLGELLTIQML